MDINDVQLVGGPCGQHGPYTFFKAFKYSKNGVKKLITLSEFFFVKMWRDSDLLCIGELQLLWMDKNNEQTLASLRLYFLPENTPEGRMDQGEDEVLAISEKVVIRLDDLITWITVETEWNFGRLAKCEDDLKDVTIEADQLACPRKPAGNSFTLSEIIMDFSDVEQEREKFEETENSEPHVIILSFPKYCRYRAMMKRLEDVENAYIKFKIVNALGGFYVKHPNTRVLFCRETFDYPELEGHELLCNHLAPKLKGRPRGKRKKRSISPGSESNESESSISNQFSRFHEKSNGICSTNNSTIATRRSTRCHENNENKQFMKILSDFMRSKQLPMGRIPSLGYKELNFFFDTVNLHEFYARVQKLGGYECVTANRLWKSVFDDMTGHLNSTSAATIIRRHYERFLLAYERHEKGEEDKPLPERRRRRLKNKSTSQMDTTTGSSDSDSYNSDTTTPSTSRSSTSPPIELKEQIPSGGKPSSLRSIRVKPERQKEKTALDNQNIIKSEVCLLPENDITIIKSEPTDVDDDDDDDDDRIIKPDNEEVDAKSSSSIFVNADLNNKLDIIKVEVKVETNVTVEVKVEGCCEEFNIKEEKISDIKSITESIKSEAASIPAEPTTDAVAPAATTVAMPEQQMQIDNSLSLSSPIIIEAKENSIPLLMKSSAASTDLLLLDPVVDVAPKSVYQSSSPEMSRSEEDSLQSMRRIKDEDEDDEDDSLRDVKKIKLDILKEGGLEVTPVKTTAVVVVAATSIKEEFRPSVIQPAPPTNNNNNNNNNTIITNNKPSSILMAPPQFLSNSLSKRNSITYSSSSLSPPQHKQPTTPLKQPQSSSSLKFDFNFHRTTPPKVMQSKSIYSYSEKTVYGNPKDILLQPFMDAHTPKPALIHHNLRYGGGGDPVDLSLNSPQKPMVEIMPLLQNYSASARHHHQHPHQHQHHSPIISPYARTNVSKNLYKSSSSHPQQSPSSSSSTVIDGRKLGPNLEITLVGPKQQQSQQPQQQQSQHHLYHNYQQQQQQHLVNYHQTNNHHHHNNNSSKIQHKRSNSSDSSSYAQKIAKLKSEEYNSRHSSSKYSPNNIPSAMHKTSMDNNNIMLTATVPTSYYQKNHINNNTTKSSSSSSSSSMDYRHQHQHPIPTPVPSPSSLLHPHHSSVSSSVHHPSSHLHHSHHQHQQQQQQQNNKATISPQHQLPPTATLPHHYLANRYSSSDNPFLPIMDPLYYQAALQNVYSSIPPILPMPTPEQLKFYAEFMAHQGRINGPYPPPHHNDGHSSSSNNSNNNNISSNKKQ